MVATSRPSVERVADAVDKVEVPLVILSHQVAGADPGISGLENIAEDSLLRILFVRVALEPASGIRGSVRHLVRASPGRFGAQGTQNPWRSCVGRCLRYRRRPAPAKNDAPGTPECGRSRRISWTLNKEMSALSSGIASNDPGNAESFLEVVPNLRSQPVATGDTNPVHRFLCARFRVKQVPGEFPIDWRARNPE